MSSVVSVVVMTSELQQREIWRGYEEYEGLLETGAGFMWDSHLKPYHRAR